MENFRNSSTLLLHIQRFLDTLTNNDIVTRCIFKKNGFDTNSSND